MLSHTRFHHIKSPKKRRSIAEWAHELRVGGFAKLGYPGVMVLEGNSVDVDKFVLRLKAQQWKAMAVRGERAGAPLPSAAALDAARRLGGSARKVQVRPCALTCTQQRTPKAAASWAVLGEQLACWCGVIGHSCSCKDAGNDRSRRWVQEMGDKELGALGAVCRDAGLEDLFLAALKLEKVPP